MRSSCEGPAGGSAVVVARHRRAAVVVVIFIVPFIFIVLTAAKDRPEASRLEFTLPTDWLLLPNLLEVMGARNGLMLTAMRNSVILTVASVALIVFLSAMVGFVLQRRRDRTAALVAVLMLAGLVVPPAIVPTIYVLQSIGLFKTLIGRSSRRGRDLHAVLPSSSSARSSRRSRESSMRPRSSTVPGR